MHVEFVAPLTFSSFFDAIGRSLREGFFMFWETLWALVLGFTLSGFVQTFISKEQMHGPMGGTLVGVAPVRSIHHAATISPKAGASPFNNDFTALTFAAAGLKQSPYRAPLRERDVQRFQFDEKRDGR